MGKLDVKIALVTGDNTINPSIGCVHLKETEYVQNNPDHRR